MAQPLTLREAVLLARDTAAQPWHVLTVLVLDGPIGREELSLRIAERIAYTPRFRQKLLGTGVQSWADDSGFRVGGHVREVELAPGARFEEWLGDLLAVPIDRLHPLWDAAVVSGLEQGRTAVVFRVHPALVDGNEHVHLLQELLDDRPTPIEGPAPSWTPTTEDGGGLLAGLSDPFRFLQNAAAGLTGLAESGFRQATAVSLRRVVAGVRVELADVRRARAAYGCTVHDVLLALATAGVREWFIDQEEEFGDPVALVPQAVLDDDHTSAVGCQVLAQWVGLPVTAATARQRLSAIATFTRSRVDTARTVPAGELAALAGFAPPTLHALAAGTVQAGAAHSVLIANAPGPRNARYLGERRVVSVHSVDSCVDTQRISVAVTSYRDHVTLTATAVAPLRGFARAVGDELGRLLREAR